MKAMKRIAVGLCFWALIIACSFAGAWLSENPLFYTVVASLYGVAIVLALSWVIGDLILSRRKGDE